MATGNLTVDRFANVESPAAQGWRSFIDSTPCNHKHRTEDAAWKCGSKRLAEARALARIADRDALQEKADAAVERIRERLAKRQAPAAEEILWSSDMGEILCTEHAGFYLAQEIQRQPARRFHYTPLGGWSRMTATEIHEYRFAVRDLPSAWSEHLCESCREKALAPRDAGEATAEPMTRGAAQKAISAPAPEAEISRGSRVRVQSDEGIVRDIAHESCPPDQRIALIEWSDGTSDWWGFQSITIAEAVL